MIISMTGFGRSEKSHQDKTLVWEIRTLNSKQLDLNCKLPSAYKEKEMDVRRICGASLVRGKSEVTLRVDGQVDSGVPRLNPQALLALHAQLKPVLDSLGIDPRHPELLATLLRQPEVFTNELSSLSPEDWAIAEAGLREALDQNDAFRLQEGNALEADLRARVAVVESCLEQLAPFEQERIASVRQRLEQSLIELAKTDIDQNRFQQELIFYIEKLDINEEKVRLANHCSFFLKTMEEQEAVGKKLGFIAQEMGREINTIGSKSNHTAMQKLVVVMKDELEKIKEQLSNVL